jgi:hypothetical protein
MIFTLEELTGKAVGFFIKDSSLEFIFATEDGQFFYAHNEKHAKNHASKSRIKLLKIERPIKKATPKKEMKNTKSKK